jgi:SAM-dependent methyltransferase
VPRERGLMYALALVRPDWARMSVHESSPGDRGVSTKLERSCRLLLRSQYYPDQPSGATINGFVNANLENQPFRDEQFDVVISQDVFEHVNRPDLAAAEIGRTLRPGGVHVFTTPTYRGIHKTERQAEYKSDGSITHLAEPEYHGNPIGDGKALVTFHFAYDLPELIFQWSGLSTTVLRFHRPDMGILGPMTEVYISEKPWR